MKHPDYDELRRMLGDVGNTVRVRAGALTGGEPEGG